MRKQDLRLDTMYMLDSTGAFHAPCVLASLSDEFHLSRGEVGRGSPTGRGLRTWDRRSATGKFPMFYLAIVRYPGVANLDEFTAWAEGGPIPAEHAEYLAIARKVGDWLEGLTEHHYTAVPDGLIPSAFRLAEVRTRELTGEWLAIQQEKLAAEATREAWRAKQNEKLAREKGKFAELVEAAGSLQVAGSFGLDPEKIKPYLDARFAIDYTKVVLPVTDLLALLTSLKPEG